MTGNSLVVHHLVDKFLPFRQAYLLDLLEGLDTNGVHDEVYTYAKENESVFRYSNVTALDSYTAPSKFFHKLEWKLLLKRTFLSQLCAKSPSERDAIHHAHFLATAQASADIGRRSRKAFVQSLYGEDELFRAASGIGYPAISRVLETISRYADVILVPSEFYAGIVGKLLPRKRVEVVRLGIDTSRYSRAGHSGRDQFKILCVARLIERKGLEYLIRAMPRILRESPQTDLVIVGEGNMRESLIRLAKDLRVEGNLHILPYQESLVTQYAAADVFVMPSIIQSDGITEGLGVSILEAEASGLPIVASSVGGIPEAVEDGSTGFLVPPSDEGAIAEKTLRLLLDSDLRRTFGANAIGKIDREYNLLKQSQLLFAQYRRLSKA